MFYYCKFCYCNNGFGPPVPVPTYEFGFGVAKFVNVFCRVDGTGVISSEDVRKGFEREPTMLFEVFR